jgi:hypothetical protein
MFFLQAPGEGNEGSAVWQSLLGPVPTEPLADGTALAPTTNACYPFHLLGPDEANTLADPAYLGQLVVFRVSSAAPDALRRITVAQPFDKEGHTILVFPDEGAFCWLMVVAKHTTLTGITFIWQIVSNNGVDLGGD